MVPVMTTSSICPPGSDNGLDFSICHSCVTRTPFFNYGVVFVVTRAPFCHYHYYYSVLVLLEYTRGGRWRPACFLNLLIRPVRDRILRPGGGAGYFQILHFYLKKNKTLSTDKQTNIKTDIWSRLGTTSAQIPVAVAKISGSESECQRYLHRTGSGTGPDAYSAFDAHRQVSKAFA